MAKSKEQEEVMIKYAYAFNMLLQENKDQKRENKRLGFKDIKLISSLGGISSEARLRKATLTEIFAGTSNPEALTIELILKALRKNFAQFSAYFDNVAATDLARFREDLIKNKAKYSRTKTKKLK
jgi:hypothetical protein